MKRRHALTPQAIGDTDPVAPTVQRPVRSRTRALAVDAHFEPHCHPWAQLAYCAQGLIQVTANDLERQTTFILPPSRAVWIPPDTRHAVTVLEATELRTVYLDPSATPPSWRGCRVLVVSSLMRELIRALEASTPGVRDDALMTLTLHEITHASTQSLGVPLPRDKRLRALCQSVLQAPGRCATLAQWAVNTGASERTVARLFRTELATTFQQWRQQAVLAHALPMLACGTPVSEVAAASGYASDSAFSAMFKSALGQSPSYFQHKNGVRP
ncbi:MAG: helix-turn-helix transcriptional regulator [Rhodoferax sp.]|nr:helix-turn-helix transcriptional regulator [Rhodoferax sp.]MBP7493344.1 helix-turn-helix transcriptional regulator [Rhodoferax sp.]